MKKFITPLRSIILAAFVLVAFGSGPPTATAQSSELCDQMRETWNNVCSEANEAAGSASREEERASARRMALACASHAATYANTCLMPS